MNNLSSSSTPAFRSTSALVTFLSLTNEAVHYCSSIRNLSRPHTCLFFMELAVSTSQKSGKYFSWHCITLVSVFQHYSELYDLSRSERAKVHELAVIMATDGQPLEHIGELLHVAVGPLDLSVKMVLRDAVEKAVTALRYFLCLLFFFTTRTRKTFASLCTQVIQQFGKETLLLSFWEFDENTLTYCICINCRARARRCWAERSDTAEHTDFMWSV